ncbi:MAG: pyridine nucleotide-disulfide oxidoreductase/dicluster-binding protein [Sedimentibacter sp.]|uniref:pyridine nucleotide-disulfide oxidoreductase/dicluster-binding protein n=1 Tax=Sedimentibacter sp. TaxID=1960295 RepID=UPI003158B09C
MNLDKILQISDRCINDAPPSCSAYCPLHIDIKSFIDEIEKNNFDKAYKIIEKRMVFPRIISMICDHPCENVCVRDKNGGSVLIGELEKSAVLYGYAKPKKGYAVPPSGKKTAVIGGGLRGITAAHDLVNKGMHIDIYEKSGRIGGRIWEYEGKNLTADVISEEFAFFENNQVSIVLNKKIDNSDLDDIIKNYDAVFLAADDLISEYDYDRETFQVDSSSLFVGGVDTDKKNSVVFAVSSSRRAAISIDRYVKKVSVTASRENEGSYISPLKYSTDDEEEKTPVHKTGEFFLKEEAVSEASRCFKCQCRDCINPCSHLRKFNIAPKAYIRNINHNERIIKGSHYANKMILSCTECGLCKEKCNYGISMKDIVHETRQSMVERKKMPPSAHDFALKDMKFSNSEKFFTYRKEVNREDIKYVFYPGCQLPASNPDYVEKIYSYLTKNIDEGVGLMLGCCGAPADWSGHAELMEENVKLIKRAWAELGSPVFILACSSCMSNFDKYISEIQCISLWEIIDSFGLPDNYPSGHSLKLNIHDPCTSRHKDSMQESIRNIIAKLGCEIQELKYSKELTKCCGYGGLVYFANREQSDDFINDRIAESYEDLLVYCTMCKDLFTSKGKRTFHMLDLLFGDDLDVSCKQKMPTLSQRQQNRMMVKNKLLGQIWGEGTEMSTKDEKYAITVTEEVKGKMEEMYIVFNDIRKTVINSIEKRERFFNPVEKTYLARLRMDNVTYWVKYEGDDGKISVTNVYSHRMEVVEENHENQ